MSVTQQPTSTEEAMIDRLAGALEESTMSDNFGKAEPLHQMHSPRVLIVDDNEANLTAFEAILTAPDIQIVAVRSGREAMRQLLNEEFAVILLDINMPELDGIETARIIHERERSRHIPIIFVTAHHSDQIRVLQGYATGAVDFLVKPVSPAVLQTKVSVFVDLYRRKRQVEWQAIQLRTANAALLRAIAQRKEAEQDASFEREERQRVTLSCIADAVITTDLHGQITFMNGPAERLTGRAVTTQGMPLAALLQPCPEGQTEALEHSIRQCLRDGQSGNSAQAALVDTKGERHYVEYSVAPLRDRQQRVLGAALVLHDVTARRAAEVERERLLASEQAAREEAEQANRAKDEFLATVSHELRTPLNAIVGWLQVLERSDASSAPYAKALEALSRNAMAQKKLIEDLLDISRIMKNKLQLTLEVLDMRQVVQAALETVRPSADAKQIQLEATLAECAPVTGDGRRLQQVIWNLLSNAIKFTSAGGRIAVSLTHHDQEVAVRISDNGQGIDPTLLPQVFERFFQGNASTTRQEGGLGLGLAIVRQLVHMHGGRVHAESEGVGRGAVFTITLPVSSSPLVRGKAEPDKEIAQEQVAQDKLAGIRLLVVDDYEDAAELTATMIRQYGAEVRCARSAREAIEIFRTWVPDLLVSDISMPGEDGNSLIARIRTWPESEGGKVPAIAFTAHASESVRRAALEAGFQLHLTKPAEPQVLVQAIAKLVPQPRSSRTS